jgi:hypothetical protein
MLFVLLLGLVSLQQADRVLGDDQLQVQGAYLPTFLSSSLSINILGSFLKVSKNKKASSAGKF